MKRILLLLALASVAVLACKKNEEKATEPTVFKVTPKSASSENGFAHSLSVKVTCDVDFEYSLEDGSWISINAGEKNTRNITALDLRLGVNSGESARKDILTVTAGSQEIKVSITQNPVSSSAPVQEIRLSYIFPQTMLFQFPAAWTLSSDASWLEFEPSEGGMNIMTNVSLKAKEFNFGDEERRAELRITFDGASIVVPVLQESSLPSGEFAEKLYGLYNYDGAGSSALYDPLAHQTNLLHRQDGTLFRMVDPAGGRMIEISGLASSYSPADKLHLTIYQNWLSSLDFRSEKDVWVLKTEDSYVWLIDSEEHGFVVKK